MINSLTIKNFRGLKDSSIVETKRINVFLGKNNCGKSSVLDALYMLLQPTMPQNILAINDVRSFHLKNPDDLNINFYNGNTKNKISISAKKDNGIRTLTVTHKENKVTSVFITNSGQQNISEKDYTIEFHLDNEDGISIDTDLTIDHNEPNKIKITPKDDFPGLQSVHYITPSVPYRDMEVFFAAAVKNKQEKYISSVLNKIDNRIIDVVIVGEQILVDIGLEQRIPLQLMGDGMRKLLALIVNINTIPNGYILIDEIDNGLHYTAMVPMWKAIIETAKSKNVQVFATTHNIDSLKALNLCLSQYDEETQNELSVYSIRNYSDTDRKIVRSNYQQFNHLIGEELEIR